MINPVTNGNTGECVCIIGARKGSKRFPGKNKALIKGKPLYDIALDAARNTGLFKTILFSSDDEDILNNLENSDDLIVDNRPSNLAGDFVSMWDVARYLIGEYEEILGTVKTVCFINPCHPFRSAKHINEAYQIYLKSRAISLISVTAFPFPIELPIEIKNQKIHRTWNGLVRKGNYDPKYYPNGAVIFVSLEHFRKYMDVFSENTAAYVLPWPYSLDIDQEEDFRLAQKIQDIL
jgi:CMP-N-acetylneuraminic acid synthetase